MFPFGAYKTVYKILRTRKITPKIIVLNVLFFIDHTPIKFDKLIIRLYKKRIKANCLNPTTILNYTAIDVAASGTTVKKTKIALKKDKATRPFSVLIRANNLVIIYRATIKTIPIMIPNRSSIFPSLASTAKIRSTTINITVNTNEYFLVKYPTS